MATLRSVMQLVWLAPVLVAGQACAPMFSDARLVGPGQTEVTASLTPTGASVMGENRHLMTDYRIQAMRGVADRLDVGVGYARLQQADGGTGAHALALRSDRAVHVSAQRSDRPESVGEVSDSVLRGLRDAGRLQRRIRHQLREPADETPA